MKLYTVALYNLKMVIKEDNLVKKYFEGDN